MSDICARSALAHLASLHASVLARVDGVDAHDARRPLTPTGTNLLGLVKHLAHVQLEYVLDCCGRARPDHLPHLGDAAMEADEDLWLRADESAADVIALFDAALEQVQLACDELGPDAPAHVPWWPEPRTTLGALLVHLVGETARHAGHIDILREQLDGNSRARHPGGERDDDAYWRDRVATVQAAADAHTSR